MATFNSEPDRFNYIFQLALDDDEQSPLEAGLSEAEQDELATIRDVLAIIDASWRAPETAKDKTWSLFLQKLADEDPNHPWVQNKVVKTLGDLVQISSDDIPAVPEDIYQQISHDPTPIEALLDRKSRTVALGQALLQAQVPRGLTGDFLMWLNRAIAELAPAPKNVPHGLLFTRKQRPSRADK